MQDLFGQPIGAKPTFELTLWQKKQATMLYHFASMPYLKGLLDRALDLMKFINPTLDLAERQKRDDYLVDDRWACGTPLPTGPLAVTPSLTAWFFEFAN